jgi:hypothetical protein
VENLWKSSASEENFFGPVFSTFFHIPRIAGTAEKWKTLFK